MRNDQFASMILRSSSSHIFGMLIESGLHCFNPACPILPAVASKSNGGAIHQGQLGGLCVLDFLHDIFGTRDRALSDHRASFGNDC